MPDIDNYFTSYIVGTVTVGTSNTCQDAMLINQTWEKFDAVFEAKSRAAAFLHDAPETQLLGSMK